METEKNKTNEKILNLTLEIIFLLTGEDYTVLNKIRECVAPSSRYSVSEGWSTTQRPITEPPSHSLIPESNNEKKILDLIYRMIELMTGEVPRRCKDVAVFFTMEEWDYIEGHKDQYEDFMKKQWSLTSPVESANKDLNEELNTSAPALSFLKDEDGEINGNVQEIAEEPNSCSLEKAAVTTMTQYPSIKIEENPLCDGGNLTEPNTHDHTMCGSPHLMEEPYLCNEGNFPKPSIYTVMDQTQYPATPIKEEPVSNDGGNVTDPDNYTPTDHTHHPSTHMENPVSRHGGIITDPDVYTLREHAHRPSTHIKEEPASNDEGDVSDSETYTPRDHTQHPITYIKEKPFSCDEALTDTNLYKPVDHSQYVFPHIKKEPVSCDGGNVTDPDIYRPTDHKHHSSTPIKEKPFLCDKAPMDTNLYKPIDHSQYVFPHIKKEPVLSDGRALIDPDIYTPTDHTQQHTHVHIKEEPLSRDGGNLTDPENHTQQYPTTDIKEEKDEDPPDANSYTPTHTQYLFPPIKKEAVLCNGVSHPDRNIPAAIDRTQQYRSTPNEPEGNPTDHTQLIPSREEPDKVPALQKLESASLRKPENKGVRKRKHKEPEQTYNDLTISSEKYFCTIQQTTDSLEILYNCPECPECFTSNLDLAKHQIIHTGGMPFICSVCGRCFGRKSDLVIHQTTHGGSNEFGCPHCELSFATRSSLSIHEKSHVEKRPLPCPECGKTFPTQKRLTRHRQIHTDERPFKCPECGDTFKRKAHLQRHQASHEKARKHNPQKKPPLRPKPFQSSVYKTFYNLKLPLQVHQRLHAFQCLECSKSFNSKSSLQVHQRVHASGQSMASPELKVDLSKDSISSRHLESFIEDPKECGNHSTDTKRKKNPPHNSLKSLPCPVCGKGFSSEYKLKRHHSIHTLEEPSRRGSLGP